MWDGGKFSDFFFFAFLGRSSRALNEYPIICLWINGLKSFKKYLSINISLVLV